MQLSMMLEEDKDKILTAVGNADTPEQVPKLLEDELDKLLIRYNEQCDLEDARRTAASMIQAAKSCLPLVYAYGEPKIWHSSDPGMGASSAQNGSRSPFFIPVLTAGAVCGLLSTLIPSLSPQIASMAGLPVLLILAAASIGLCLLAGRLSSGKNGASGASRSAGLPVHVEIPADPSRIWNSLHALSLLMDQNLTEIIAADEWARRSLTDKQSPDSAVSLPGTSELRLFTSLLEAKYSGDGEYAIEKLGEIPYYLHKNGIETIDYSSESADLFDLLPGEKAGTLQPALVSGGKLLVKGLAVQGND